MTWKTASKVRSKRQAMAFALLIAPAAAWSQAGMMSEEGMAPVMGYGYGPGWGMGPGGMMMGPGGGPMMGGPGMGGMMGPGMGMGPGMMGGMGMGWGPGMGTGMGPLAMLDLSDDQRQQIARIQEDVRKRHWNTLGKIHEEQARLNELYAAEKPDAKQIGQAYGNIAKLQQEIVEGSVQAQNQMLDVLTKEQRDQLAQWRRGMARGYMGGRGYGPGRGMGPGMMYRGTPPAGGSSPAPQ